MYNKIAKLPQTVKLNRQEVEDNEEMDEEKELHSTVKEAFAG